MIKWFEGNPVGVVLGSVCAGLLLVLLLLGVIWSLPPSASVTDSGGDDADFSLDIPELAENEPIEAYAVITERPVFNESRQPVLEDESDGAGEDELVEEEIDAPEFELAGVIITPSIRMVTLKSKDQPESLVAFEGQPLEGNYGSWQVSRIEPRQITLASGQGEEVQLQLQIHDMTIEAPPKPESAATAGADAQANDEGGDQPLTRAEEIRQRIAERREELRRAAEEESQDQPEQDYRSTIQSMIRGTKPPEQDKDKR